ncbi:MAG TPA: dihydrofolate reductase family protein [Polyangiaceae bacterium]|nr:dihydrofolate reductase family protein [Polyangiaceae bacterium]
MTERRIVMFNQVSADGFFSDTNGALDWVGSDPEIHARAVEGMPHTDTLLLGRKTYEMFAAFWPSALENLNAPGPHGSSKSDPAFAAMARWLNDTRKLVFSRSLKTAAWHNSHVTELDPQRISALKREPGKELLIFGSGSIVSQLSLHGLIDEYRFVVCPVLLGRGKTLLGDLTERVSLKLTETKAFNSGNVMLTYRRADKL